VCTEVNLTFSWWHEQINLFLALVGPNFDDGLPQLKVSLVHFFGRTHLNAQVLPDQGKEGSGKVDHALVVDWLVHSNQLLEG
jgi:hypothetical protein